jgi:hypothetical protein
MELFMENNKKEMWELKQQLFDILSYVKDMEPGHDSTPGIFYLNFKNKHYAIKLIEMDEPTITDKDKKKYINCDDKYIKAMKCIDQLKCLI